MRRVFYWIPKIVAMMSLTLPVAMSFGQDEPKSTEPESAELEQEQEKEKVDLLPGEESFEELNGQNEALMNAFSERSQEARAKFTDANDEVRQAIMEEMQSAQMELVGKTNEIATKMLELARNESTSKEIAFKAINWVLGNSQGADERQAAVDLMVKDHLDNPEIAEAIPSFTNGLPSEATENLLIQLAENGSSDEIKGVATISLVSYLRENKELVASLVDNEAFAKQYPDSIEYFRKLAVVDDERIEGLLAKATESFAEVEYQGTTIGEMAAKELKKILIAKSLQIGKVAPDIEGPDLDGTVFKLSDYRGKVVMIDFWGDW